MARLIGVLVIVLIIVGAIGYYQGWLNVSKADRGSTTSVNVAIDKDKLKETEENAAKKIQDTGRRIKEQVGGQPSSSDK